MFTLSAVITNVSVHINITARIYRILQTIALPVGVLMDKAGPRFASLLGAFFFLCGNIVFGIGIENTREFYHLFPRLSYQDIEQISTPTICKRLLRVVNCH